VARDHDRRPFAEHASFFCEKDSILIAGDQILSHMTPSVMVPSAQPDANPMKEYLDSLTRFETLPAIRWCCHRTACRSARCIHACPMREHHLARLDDVASVVTGKTTAFMIAQEVFPRVLYANPRQALPSRWPISTCWPRSVG